MHTDVLIGFAGGLTAAWVGVAIAYRWDVRRRTVAVVARVEIIVRRDLDPPLFQSPNNERNQWVLDRADDRVRGCEEELRALATERRRYRAALRALADELDAMLEAHFLLVYQFTLPTDHPMRSGNPVPLLDYDVRHRALGEQVAELRGRLESRLP